MILEQNFLESDLVEIAEVLKKTSEYKHPILKSVTRSNKIINYLLIVFSLVLFGCSMEIVALENTYSISEIILYVSVGVISLLTVLLRNKYEKAKMLLILNMVKRKYGHPFCVALKDDTLVYNQRNFSYTEIKSVVEYKDFLFIKIRNRLLLIKADEKEKSEFYSKIRDNKNIHFLHEDKPFDLRAIK